MIVTNDKRFIKDLAFDDANEFLKSISFGGELYSLFHTHRFIFRGHESDQYKLIPTAQRDFLYLKEFEPDTSDRTIIAGSMTELLQIFSESQVIKDFFDICDNRGLTMPEVKRLRETIMLPVDGWTILKNEDWVPQELEGIAALAQHHGLPTRLLDWTTNLNTALYFASSGAIKRQVEPKRLTRGEWLNELKADKDLFETYLSGKEQPSQVSQRMEIWAFDSSILTSHLGKITLKIIHPRYSENPNLCAQEGLFSYWSIDKPTFDEIGKKKLLIADQEPFDSKLVKELERVKAKTDVYLYRITVPYIAAPDIYLYAKQNGKDASTLFPGYDGVVRCMIEDKRMKRLLKNSYVKK